MAKVPFAKAAMTPEQLLDKLRSRGLIISDDGKALAYLKGVGAYRLKGYWFKLIDPQTKQFNNGLTFDHIAERCEFDRELRAATIEAIDRLEVAIRSAMANYLSLAHSPHWFLDPKIFRPTTAFGIGHLTRKIEEEVMRSKSKEHVKHYFERYDEPYLPPSWSISECLSFGIWSKIYSILRHPQDKKAISMKFGVDQPDVFASWAHTLSVLRNIAAHHGQLLGVPLSVSPATYKNEQINPKPQKSFYAAATVVHFLLTKTGLPHRWKEDLEMVFSRFQAVSPIELGFHAGWQHERGWA